MILRQKLKTENDYLLRKVDQWFKTFERKQKLLNANDIEVEIKNRNDYFLTNVDYLFI